MKGTTHTPDGLLQQIAGIRRMEPGKLCVMRQGKNGPYYNLQWREDGKPHSRYVPSEQLETVREHTDNYKTFRGLVDQYAEQIIARTRAERLAGQKKTPKRSSICRDKNSSS